MTAADATTQFFEDLASKGHDPLLERVTATFRFELAHGGKTDRWLLAVDKGDLAVSRKNRKADCVLHAEKELFDQLARGEQNAMAAVLRGEVALEGDPRRLVSLQRLFPGPVGSGGSRRIAGYARRRS